MAQGGSPSRRGTNLTRIAGFNEAVLIDAIRRSNGGLSRVELTERTGLSAQTVSNISRRGIDSGHLQEAGRISTGPGKPRTLLTLDPTGQYAVGVHLDPLVMTFVVLDFTGKIVSDAQLDTPSSAFPVDVLNEVRTTVSRLVDRAGVDSTRIAGIGLATPGPIDAAAGVILDPPHLPRWRNVPVRDQLRELTGLPVILDKDVIAAAVGERWAGATVSHANSVFIYLGIGVGTGVTIDDVVVRGAGGNAGDIGHLVVAPGGPRCRCGLRGCLGTTVSPAALVQEAVARGALSSDHLEATVTLDVARIDASFVELCRLSSTGHRTARGVVRRAATRLAKAASTIANLVDTEIVVFGGPTWTRLADQLLPVVPELVAADLAHGALACLTVTGTALGEDVAAIGAACLVLDRAFSPRPASFAFDH